MKLALGTVQFGMRYGVANRTGQPDEEEVAAILRQATLAGVKLLDTASLYGEAEAVLGRCLVSGHNFRIVTKTPKFSSMNGSTASSVLEAAYAESCSRLRATHLYGLLAHDANDLLGPAGKLIWRCMESLRDQGRVSRIGASVYSSDQIDRLLERYPLDLVQLPLSLLDQRLVEGGQLVRLAGRQVEIHARSAFLQGVLLMPPSQLPSHLAALRPFVQRISEYAAVRGTTVLQAALRYVANLPQIAAVVCGVDSLRHFEELISAMQSDTPQLAQSEAAACACGTAALLDPSLWPRA